MSDFRKLAHLVEQLGEERFQILISSGNTGKVKDFCDELIKSALPTEMTVGGRTYEILSFLKGDEKSVAGYTMVERAHEMNAHLGKDDCEFILAHQDEIPAALRGKDELVFPDMRDPDDCGLVAYLRWDDDGWYQHWDWLDDDWDDNVRLLRRKSR
jgi:hypothetical protein